MADVKRLKAPELENTRLKKLPAEAAFDIEALREINPKNLGSAPARREQVNIACERELSQRQACGQIEFPVRR